MSVILFTAGCSKEKGAAPWDNKEGTVSSREESAGRTETYDIGIFVPGVADGSPLYEQLISGVERVMAEKENVTMKVLEAGFNQGEWEEKMVSLAATGQYELILSSNGAMPFIALTAAEQFPGQKFIIMDSIYPGHPQMATVLYNQIEQSYLVGYLGGLITKSGMDGATPALKVGMVVGQQYPAMDEMIAPGFEMGAAAVDPDIRVDFRVVGNWYDGNKAAELANSMMDGGVDVILTVCGGANQGVITAAEERGTYVLYLDADNYHLAPGTIAGCAVLHQEQAVYEKVIGAVEGTISWGSAEILDVESGYVDFIDDSGLYRETVSEPVRNSMSAMLAEIRSGGLSFDVPEYWRD